MKNFVSSTIHYLIFDIPKSNFHILQSRHTHLVLNSHVLFLHRCLSPLWLFDSGKINQLFRFTPSLYSPFPLPDVIWHSGVCSKTVRANKINNYLIAYILLKYLGIFHFVLVNRVPAQVKIVAKKLCPPKTHT